MNCKCLACHRHVSSCQENGSKIVSAAFDIYRDDEHYITKIVEFRGYSLFGTCLSREDYYIGKEYTVFNYTVDGDGSVFANVNLTSHFLQVANVESMRSKGIRCTQSVESYGTYPLSSINCTYFGIPLYGMEEEISNATTYTLLSVNRQYFVHDMNMTTTLRCTDCTCDYYSGTSTSRQFWIFFFIFVMIVVVVSAIDCLIKIIQRGRKKKE